MNFDLIKNHPKRTAAVLVGLVVLLVLLVVAICILLFVWSPAIEENKKLLTEKALLESEKANLLLDNAQISSNFSQYKMLFPQKNYEFISTMDSGGANLFQANKNTPQEIKQKLCDAHPDCKGFNTWGYFKNSILPKEEWQPFSDNPEDGLYIKQ